MWISVVLLVWLQVCSSLPPPAALNPAWHDLNPEQDSPMSGDVTDPEEEEDDELTINQFERELQSMEKLMGLKGWAEAAATGMKHPRFVMESKRGRGAHLEEISRLIARLFQFTNGRRNQKKSLHDIPIQDLPPSLARAIEDQTQWENNLKEGKGQKGQGQLEVRRRSELPTDAALQMSLDQLRGLMDKVKDDKNPLQSMMEHVTMEMKEETGNRLVDDDEYFGEWLPVGDSASGGSAMKRSRGRKDDIPRLGRYGRLRFDRWYPIFFHPRHLKEEREIAESKRGFGDKRGYGDKRGFGDK